MTTVALVTLAIAGPPVAAWLVGRRRLTVSLFVLTFGRRGRPDVLAQR